MTETKKSAISSVTTPFKDQSQSQSQSETISINLGTRSYDIHIGQGLIAAIGTILKDFSGRKIAVVTDDIVAPLWLEKIEKNLATAGFNSHSLILPAGEASKSFAHLEQLLAQLLALKIERRDLIIALGGGVIGDLAGFAASILRRGVDLVQIPTSLLAQVDSSVGGKTGINSPYGKNLIGSFYQPKRVLIDLDSLKSLPPRHWRAGYAEIVKYGLIDNAPFFHWLEENGTRILEGDQTALLKAIKTSVKAKAQIVAEDEREEKGGRRALLNLGHSFGHALEAAFGYDGRLLHGEAVSIGLVMASRLSAQLGLAPQDHAARIERHLYQLGLPVHPSQIMGAHDVDLSPEALSGHLAQDKKAEAGTISFILGPIGGAHLYSAVTSDALKACLQEASIPFSPPLLR